ncbi:MAG TPA: hypothetical protein VJ715_16585 [Pyrinomonadaceae bacterium]|nr:hypothetical protein [Pyrinomonadaceae bacterium]
MMKKLLLVCALAGAFFTVGASVARAQNSPSDAIRPGQEQLIGEITSFDTATGQVTVKTTGGQNVTFQVGDETSLLRIAPGERSLDKAEKITRADVSVGDRVLVRGGASGAASGQPFTARQLIVVSRQALDSRREREREDWRRRSINGRITALNPAAKEVTVAVRSREGAQDVVVQVADNVKLLRYAPDSVRREDARQSSFADLKVGDQLRALGERSADGARFTPEEIIAGAFSRTRGTIVETNAERGEVTIKDEQTGKNLTVVVGKHSSVRRIPAEFVEEMARRREERQQRRAAEGNSPDAQQGERRRRGENREGGPAGEGERGQGRRRGGGGPGGGGAGGFQRMFENLPAVTISDLKKGDMVMVTGTPTASDASRVTAITLVTGDPELMKRLQQFQGQGAGQRGMSPGLPGDVVGGGTGDRNQP